MYTDEKNLASLEFGIFRFQLKFAFQVRLLVYTTQLQEENNILRYLTNENTSNNKLSNAYMVVMRLTRRLFSATFYMEKRKPIKTSDNIEITPETKVFRRIILTFSSELTCERKISEVD